MAALRAQEQAAGLRVWKPGRLSRGERKRLKWFVAFPIDGAGSWPLCLWHGAAAKGNTLLNYAGVRSDLLSAVADRAASKQGRYLPGSHIPVISSEQLAQRDPDTLLVLPWNLIEEVGQQWPSQRLVTAIPELRLRG